MYKKLLTGGIVLILVSCGSTGVGTSGGSTSYQCDGRQYCSEMDSYEEAVFFLKNCPNVKMDGDNDGIPCEKQFSR